MASSRIPAGFLIERYLVDLETQTVLHQKTACQDLEDLFGGAARGFGLLEERPVKDAYDPEAMLIMNLGVLSGTDFMTGLRTYFHAYSPLKSSKNGAPAAMWTAGSGKFGTKLRHLGIEEVIFVGRATRPTLLRLTRPDSAESATFEFLDASDLLGRHVNDKIQTLHASYPEAHFAVVGPAGENYPTVRFAAIALSTENQLRSGDPKPRFCGRGGIGGVMGSKNLIAIAADVQDGRHPKVPVFKQLNLQVARGEGSRRFRDKKKNNGGGGTWANYEALNPVHAMPEYNFAPTGTDVSVPLYRDHVEQGPYVIKDESCFRCGISCHKNVYDKNEQSKAGKFRAKLDYEPLNLLSSNIGIFDIDQACTLVELVDEMGMDSISCGVTLSYAMEYNRRHAEKGSTIADGLSYGDFEACKKAILEMGQGRLDALGQGCKRLSEQTGETGYAMHCKGVEFPAYLPQTNPGYPWALAGGHMSMKTYLLLLWERNTEEDYWVEAITEKGWSIMRDDVIGICKFAGMKDVDMAKAISALTGLDISGEDIRATVRRVFLRGYRLERRQGFTDDDYVMPQEIHKRYDAVELPYFNSPEFFEKVQKRVIARLDEMLTEEGMNDAAAT